MVGVLALTAGCDSGSAPEATPADTEKVQKNEMEARQKAYGKQGVAGANSAKAAKAAAPAAVTPAAETPAK
ncbi:hypothetical protein [Paludisphaera borealis]|uniref:hypothetical protein n=1 Tax=Paludisphaera borealis TaxID=1387353 RepID=UPI0011AB4009|nr:hypothetical protein [Paludisphaera borealis]